MAAEYITSASITAAKTLPIYPATPSKTGPSRVESVNGYVAPVAAAANSVYRVCSIPTGARIKKINVVSAAMTGVTAVDFGVAEPLKVGDSLVAAPTYANSTAANQYLFKQGQSLASALTGTDLCYAATTADNAQKQLWELAGYSADPDSFCDLVLTVTTGAAVAGKIFVEVDYSGVA